MMSSRKSLFHAWLPLLAMIAVHAPGAAQERISKPGFYSGYSRQLYSEWKRTSIYIEVRDGTLLAADIYRPAVSGEVVSERYPVVWEGTAARGRRDSSGKAQRFAETMRTPDSGPPIVELTKYGYVVVEVERRGLGASFGAMRGYHDWTEDLDAYDVTEWLAKQPFSDGKIGMFGCSNTGEAALHGPITMPPHLKAIFPGCFSWNKYDGFLRGGILAQWGTGPQSNPQAEGMSSIPVDADSDLALLKQAIQDHTRSTWLLAVWKSMPYRDSWSDVVNSRFWEEGSASTYRVPIERSGVGVYAFGGWYDDFRRDMFVTFASLHNRMKVLIGPWGHCQNRGFDLTTERLRFFDYWLKGIDNGIMNEPPITYYTIDAPDGKEWRTASQWPLPDEKRVNIFLASGKSGSVNSLNDGTLAGAASGRTEASDKFTVNYKVSCAADWPLYGQTCVHDDVGLTYTTAPFASDLEVTGHPVLHLWVSSTVPEGNTFAYLEDVGPDGKTTIVSDGRLRHSLRSLGTPDYNFLGLPWHRSFEADAVPMPVGKPIELIFDLLPTSKVFQAGHRMRLTLLGADPREKERAEVTPPPQVTVYRGGEHASYLSLPVIGTSGLANAAASR